MSSHIKLLKQLGSRLVELLRSAHLIKANHQIVDSQAALFRPLKILNDFSVIHHNQSVAKINGVSHRVSYHQSVQFFSLDDLGCQLDHLFGAFGIKRCGMFIEKQQLGFQTGCHQEG
jgi:hypothetical protein